MLEFKEDIYNGITICKTSIIQENFRKNLQELILYAKEADKNLIWLLLDSCNGSEIAIALNLGFQFHSCSESELVLVFKLKEVYIPFMPTHTVGVGGIVIADGKILMIQERIKSHRSIYKLPGGSVELGSSLEESVVREVYEETGIKTELEKMVALLNAHPYRFNKANSYYVFKLKPLNFNINIIDTNEIALALWYDLDKFFADEKMSEFQKELVKSALSEKGLSRVERNNYFEGKDFIELYLS